MISKVTGIVGIAVAFAILPSLTAAGPVTVEVHVNLIPDGDFTAPPAAWALDPGCAHDVAAGPEAPSLTCSSGFNGTGQVFCGNPADPSTCNSNFGGSSQQFAIRQVKLLPVYVGEAAPGYTVQRYEVSLDYRLVVSGQVQGDPQNCGGNANTEIHIGIRKTLDPTDLVAHVAFDNIGAGTGCQAPFNTFSADSGWRSSPPFAVHEQIAGLSGQTVDVGVHAACFGGANQGGSANPVSLSVSCQAWVDNVALKAVYTTP